MWSIVRKLYWILAVILISGCSGSGCAGCAGGALHEIPGGYPITPETRVPRSAQIRLTQSGLTTVQAIAPGLLSSLTGAGFNVPTSTQSFGVGAAIVCPSGHCPITVGLPTTALPLQLAFQPPNAIAARVRITARGSIPVEACLGSCSSSCGGFFCAHTSLSINIDTTAGAYTYIGLSTDIAISRDIHPPRQDYHRADIVSPTGSGAAIQETPGESIETADITCSGNGILCGVVDALRGTLISQLSGQLSNALGPIQNALSQKSTPNPPGCPTGTTDHSGTCQYADGSGVPDLLGLEGTGNFGALLARLTPGLQAPASYVLAAGDHVHDAQVINSGMSIDLFGAMQSGGHSVCVPHIAEPMVATIPEWTTLQAETVPGTTTPMDLGIGVSEDYMNHAAFQLWDAGLFCLGVGTSTSQQLSAGTFAILPQLSSLRYVFFPNSTAAMAIALRPQEPPNVHVGHGTNVMTDPLLTLTLPHLAIDFYTWSEERFVRVMTLTTDLTIPLNLQADSMGLMPVLGTIQTNNLTTSNSQLLSNDPMSIGVALQAILGPVVGMLGGTLPAVHLPTINVPGAGGTSLGTIAVNIPAMGIQGVTEGSSRYLGIFANMAFTPPGAMHDSVSLHTTAHLDGVLVNPAFFRIPSALRFENLPRVSFDVGTPDSFGHPVEYSYRVDGQTWSMFSSETRYTLQDFAFAAQGTHTIDVRARIAAMPDTADTDPAQIDFVIDTEAPHLHAHIDGDVIVASATDDVSPTVLFAYQFNGGSQSPWGITTRMDIPQGTDIIRVFARDASGNVAQVGVNRTALIRGGPSTNTAASGCGCTVAGADATPRTGMLSLAALAAALGLISRRRTARLATARTLARGQRVPAAAWLLPLAVGLGAYGCSSDAGSNHGNGDAGGNGPMVDGSTGDLGPSMCTAPAMLCPTSNLCITPPDCPACMPGYGPMAGATFNAATCTFDTSTCSCQRLPPLAPGAYGTYLSMATGTDGSVWLAGYSEGVPDMAQHYGDLIVGQLADETYQVGWVHVDGVPAGTPTADPLGWRGGISDPGPDVGRFTSIAISTNFLPRVSYWDVDNRQLKFASLDGAHWTTETVDTASPNGQYGSLVLVSGNIPVVAYRASVLHGEVVSSVVRIARASTATPMSATDWTTTDVVSTPSLCRASDCPMGTACRKSDGHCVATSTTCTASCTASQACIGTACTDVFPSTWVESVPPGVLYTHLVADTGGRLYITWYDRDRGNLMLVSSDTMGHWGAPTILDGEDPTHNDTGDRGIYATTALAADGSLHIAYVDGWQERLLYLHVTPGMAAGTPEVIDDGSAAGSAAFSDGMHIVGDSPSIQVTPTGVVRVAYGDSTAGTLRLAVRAAMGGATPWTLSILDQANNTGYWATISGADVATWWRDLSMDGMRRWGVRVTPLH